MSKNDFGNKLRHHLHGGKKSYDRILWNTHVLDSKDGVTFSVLDPHGSEVNRDPYPFFSRESDSTITNVRSSVRPSVCLQNPSTA